MLPAIYRPESLRAVENLKTPDLVFLARYHADRASEARHELALRMH
jgi:hypothetical protein